MRALIALMWLLHWLPLPILGRLGEALGSLLFIIMKPRRHITLTNLRLCFPEKARPSAPSSPDNIFRPTPVAHWNAAFYGGLRKHV